ncbi:MAG: alpha/beta hydrolase [Treponema sp.]|nr:alpha/beta hydrolase [Treponema sp.]
MTNRVKKSVLFIILLTAACMYVQARERIYLWRGVPGMETQVRDTVLYPQVVQGKEGKPTAAVIICPGGSYHHLGMSHEGFASADWFNSIGVSAFVLRYRVAYNAHHYPAQLEDIQMAIHYIRTHAAEYGVDATRIGAIGYSAGGHLVTMAGVYGKRDTLSPRGVSVTESLAPDFVMPIYPVVSMQEDIGHKWSRKSLLGRHRNDQSWRDEFSMELQVPADMPPVFLLACKDDPVVIYENSVRLDAALTAKGVSHVFYTHETGGHGFGMKKTSDIMLSSHWNDTELLPWLKQIFVIEE